MTATKSKSRSAARKSTSGRVLKQPLSSIESLGKILSRLPDDEVFTTDEIMFKLYKSGVTAVGGRVRDWIKSYPGFYMLGNRGLIVGTPTAIAAFCKFHQLPNLWQK